MYMPVPETIDERFARDDVSYGRSYFLSDAQGSTLALLDSSQLVRQTYSYEPYGEVTSSGSSDNTYQYTGRENDGTGLFYYRARYYSPSKKRFISEDPIGLSSGLNSYEYVRGNPNDGIDPTGKVVVFKGDPYSVFLLQLAYAKIGWTPTGSQLESNLEGPVTYTIDFDGKYGMARTDYDDNQIDINPYFHPQVLTSCGWQRATTDLVLEHELGHLASGPPGTADGHVRDDGPGPLDHWNNVIQNENPYREEAGYPDRTGLQIQF